MIIISFDSQKALDDFKASMPFSPGGVKMGEPVLIDGKLILDHPFTSSDTDAIDTRTKTTGGATVKNGSPTGEVYTKQPADPLPK